MAGIPISEKSLTNLRIHLAELESSARAAVASKEIPQFSPEWVHWHQANHPRGFVAEFLPDVRDLLAFYEAHKHLIPQTSWSRF